MAELAPDLDLSRWNGLFVHKDTSADMREKTIAVAVETMMSERAQAPVAEAGALVCWSGTAESAAPIANDIATLGTVATVLE